MKNKLKNKKNRMSISCEVEDEVNFKAICDVLNNKINPKTINGNHSKTIVKLMRSYYKNAYKNLTLEEKYTFDVIKSVYKQNKLNNDIL